MKHPSLVLIALLLGAAVPAAAEDWKPVPGDASAYYDNDYLKVDQQSGLVLLRFANGKPRGAGYKDWPPGKSPIMVYAVDCGGDGWMDLGLDFDGKAALPKGWRNSPKEMSIALGVGGAGTAACEAKDKLPTVALP